WCLSPKTAIGHPSGCCFLASSPSPPSFSSPRKAQVVFVLGGPGSGKGTQCDRIVENYSYTHLSVGDLLRAERSREGSEFGQLIDNHIKDGKIVPFEITTKLLKKVFRREEVTSSLTASPEMKKTWTTIMDGEADVKFVLVFDCSNEDPDLPAVNTARHLTV
uniref:Cytidine/uridine monophosphate kinase 1 n=1 Tax=Hucho hucho TaxID=62062 RepID=A0A4W5MCK5_9TELE